MASCSVKPFGHCFLPPTGNAFRFRSLRLRKSRSTNGMQFDGVSVHTATRWDTPCEALPQEQRQQQKKEKEKKESEKNLNYSNSIKNIVHGGGGEDGGGFSILAHPPYCPSRHGTFERCPIVSTPSSSSSLPFPGIAVCTIVCHQDKMLLTRRASWMRAFPGVWVVPGGHLDRGEDFLTAAAREVQEEVGIVLDRSSFQFVGVWESCFPIHPKPVPPKRHTIVLYFAARPVQEKESAGAAEPPTVTLAEQECDDFRWVRLPLSSSSPFYRYAQPPLTGCPHGLDGIETGAGIAHGSLFMMHYLKSATGALGGKGAELLVEALD